jgi:hypothetical protein
MKRTLHSFSAFLAILALAGASTVWAAGGGSGEEGDADDNIDIYLALGAAVLIGAILILDVFSGPEGEAIGTEPDAAISPDSTIGVTGVDWAPILEEGEPFLLAVSVFPSSLGESSAEFLREYLTQLPETHIRVYPDLLHLGIGSASEEALLAGEFFGTDLFVTATGDSSSISVQLYKGAEGPLWSAIITPSDSSSLTEAAESLAAFVSVMPR